MKTEAKRLFRKMNQNRLVDLFSTALSGCSYLCVDNGAEFKENYKKTNVDENDSLEDKMAKIILSGQKVKIIDWWAEGHIFSELGQLVDEKKKLGDVVYSIGEEDILKACNSEEGNGLAVTQFIDEMGDYLTANCLLQIIMFGEIIY